VYWDSEQKSERCPIFLAPAKRLGMRLQLGWRLVLDPPSAVPLLRYTFFKGRLGPLTYGPTDN
jgi:hypothetical protein